MNSIEIIKKEGYRREDLTAENKKVMSFLDHITEDFDNLKDNLEFIDKEMVEDGEIGKIKREIAIKVISAAEEWMEACKADIQISLAENQPNNENK